MTNWYFKSYNHHYFQVQIKFNMAHEFFQWLPLIFNDFSRQNAIFPGLHKIQWLFKSRVKFHDFSRPVPTMQIVGTTPYQLISLSFEVHEPSHSYLLLLKNLTLKIQGQGHGWGEHWKSHHGSNILLTHIPFVPSQSAIPFLRYSIFRIWPWKSKVKVMGERNVESHNMGPTLYRLTSLSFHVNRPCHSWDTAFSKFDLENPRPRSKVRWMLKTTTCVQHYSQSAIPFLRYEFFQIWPWKSKVKVMVEVQVESHKVGVTSYRFTSLPCQSALPFLR